MVSHPQVSRVPALHCSTALHGCRLQSPATRCSAMVSNVTTLVCDIVPLWSGYIWLAQVGSSTLTC